MKKFKKFINRIKKRYYSFMMYMSVEQSVMALVEYGEESKEYLEWIDAFRKYSGKLMELAGETF